MVFEEILDGVDVGVRDNRFEGAQETDLGGEGWARGGAQLWVMGFHGIPKRGMGACKLHGLVWVSVGTGSGVA